MISGNLALNCIKDIPWENHPLFAFSEIDSTSLQLLSGELDKIPTKNLQISFHDDKWDFNSPNAERKMTNNIINFEGLPDKEKNYIKFFMLYKLGNMTKLKISTARKRVWQLKTIISDIYKSTNHKNLGLITTEDIHTVIVSRDLESGYASSYYGIAAEFFSFLSNHYNIKVSVDCAQLNKLKTHLLNDLYTYRDENKLPNIPQEYFNAIVNKCIEVRDDETIETTFRMIACAILILSQTGFRINDLLDLNIDSLKCKTLTKSRRQAYYIHYTARKPSAANQPLLEFDIFSSPICTDTFKKVLELRSQYSESKNLQSLFISPDIFSKKIQAFTDKKFKYYYHNFFMTFLLNEASKEWDGIPTIMCQIFNKTTHKVDYIPLNIPKTHQFRVYVCSDLYNNKKVSLEYIKRYMGHLSESMAGYYVRPKDTYQENIKYTEDFIQNIAENDFTPLGHDLIGEEIKEAIKKFIDDNNFNVKTDIAEIIRAFGDKLIIRGKTGGVCIKTSLVPCSRDVRSNELLCAYNLCPNLFHFFYMIDVTYENFKTLQETYKINKDNGKRLDAQKELNKLKDICRRKLIPELDELEKELNKKGYNFIIEQYPSLIDIIENMDDIRKEIELWLKK